MAYTAPTAADLKARFPAFASVSDSIVNAALGEAARLVDESWTEADFATARMLYAGHVMLLEGNGTGSEAGLLADMPAGYKKVRAGGSEIERFGSATSSGASSSLDATTYGARFKLLLRQNRGGAIAL